MRLSFDPPPSTLLLDGNIELLSEAAAAYLSYLPQIWCQGSAAGLSLRGLPRLCGGNFVNIPLKNPFGAVILSTAI